MMPFHIGRHDLGGLERGFSLMELLVASMLTSIIIGGILTSVVDTKRFIERDRTRMSANQTLRATMELIGQDIRLVGQRLGGVFPAVELVDGGDTGSDILVLKRRVISETLTLCGAPNDSDGWVQVASPDGDIDPTASQDTEPSCVFSATGAAEQFNAFKARREKSNGNALVYLYNPTSRKGLFLKHLAESESAGIREIKVAGSEVNFGEFPPRSVILALEEAVYRVNPETRELELAINQPYGDILPVGNNISRFDVQIRDNEMEIMTSWSADRPWGEAREFFVSLALSPSAAAPLRAQDRTLYGSFFPRNLLSF